MTEQRRSLQRVPSWAVAVAVVVTLSLLVWWRPLVGGLRSTTICGCGDPAFTLWYLGLPGHVMVHGGGLLFSSLLWHPTGVDVLDAASSLGLGLPLAWVSIVAGPVATLNVALISASALSALSLWLLLRRWGCSGFAALVAGVLFGFSPTVVMNLAEAHLVVGFLAPGVLLILCIDELLLGRRSRERMAGVAAAALVVLEFLISPEVLVMTGTALAVASGAALAGAVQQRGRLKISRRTRQGVAIAVVLSACGLVWPAFAALAGPAHVTGSVYPSANLWHDGTTLRHLVVPTPASSVLHAFAARFGGFQGPQLSADYIGVGVVFVAGLSLFLVRRRPLSWILAGIAALFVMLSLGIPGNGWRPWEVVGRLPVFEDLIPSRLLVVVWFCLASLIGFGLDAASTNGRSRLWQPILAGIALAPTVVYLAPALPLAAETVAAPRVFSDLSGQIVLPIPSAFSAIQSSLAWQSVTGYSWAMAGGDGPGSDPRLRGRDRLGVEALMAVSGSFPPFPLVATSSLSVRASLERWGVTRIVMAAGHNLPAYDLPVDPTGASALVTAATGRIPVRGHDGWVWTFDAATAPPPRLVPFHRCTVRTAPGVAAMAACVLHTGSGAQGR